MRDSQISPQAHVSTAHVANQRHHAAAGRLNGQDGAHDEVLGCRLVKREQDRHLPLREQAARKDELEVPVRADNLREVGGGGGKRYEMYVVMMLRTVR